MRKGGRTLSASCMLDTFTTTTRHHLATNPAMDESPLNKLPGELRNQIYELALYHGRINIDTTPYLHHPADSHFPGAVTFQARHALALRSVCKQLEKETTQIFYAINTFVFVAPLCQYSKVGMPVKSFRHHIGAQKASYLRPMVISAGPRRTRWSHNLRYLKDEIENDFDDFFYMAFVNSDLSKLGVGSFECDLLDGRNYSELSEWNLPDNREYYQISLNLRSKDTLRDSACEYYYHGMALVYWKDFAMKSGFSV